MRLEQNYRSTRTILEAANNVIAHNESRMGKNLWTDNDKGERINYFRADDEQAEAVYVADTVIRANKAGGTDYKDFAVLYRANAQSRALEEALFRSGVPYRIYGGIRFYERKEIKDTLAYLRVIVNPTDDLSVKRVINVPKRGIGDTTVERLSKYAADNDVCFFNAAENAKEALAGGSRAANVTDFVNLIKTLREAAAAKDFSIAQFIEEVAEKSGLLDELRVERENETDDVDRVANVKELINKAVEFEQTEGREDKGAAAFLEEVALVADIDAYNENDDAMSLMTMHSAKGLEFKRVFIVGMEETVFPGWRAVSSGEIKDIEEERRLCYVAITRAREQLYITNAVSRRLNGNFNSNQPSRFLKEMPKELLEGGAQTRQQGLKPRTITQPEALGYDPFKKRDYKSPPVPVKSQERLDFGVGDIVTQARYGEGEVLEIRAAGADYEVTVEFFGAGRKKFMAHLARLEKKKE